jgi:hypothetical protein
MEHRWGRRVEVNIPVQLRTAKASPMGIGQLANLSVSGALLIVDCSLRILTQIHVRLECSLLPQHEAPTIAGFVARHHCHRGIGVEWCESAPTLVTDLLRAICAERDGHLRPTGVQYAKSCSDFAQCDYALPHASQISKRRQDGL